MWWADLVGFGNSFWYSETNEGEIEEIDDGKPGRTINRKCRFVAAAGLAAVDLGPSKWQRFCGVVLASAARFVGFRCALDKPGSQKHFWRWPSGRQPGRLVFCGLGKRRKDDRPPVASRAQAFSFMPGIGLMAASN